jgi:Fur family zinc uptake transcriptional regulator
MAATLAGHGGEVAAALAAAEAACLRRGAQLTELRRQVLQLVLEAGQPIGAYALLDRLRAARPGAAPPTVYRALDFLLDHGLIHKVERLNAFIGCAGSATAHDHCAGHGHEHPHQFLICGRCGATAELCDPEVARAVSQAARAAGFAATRTTVEVEGLCAVCAGAAG